MMRSSGLPAIRIQIKPIQARKLSLPRVRMLPKTRPMMAETATKTAVHAPWVDTALSPMDRLSIPEPATKIQSCQGLVPGGFAYG